MIKMSVLGEEEKTLNFEKATALQEGIDVDTTFMVDKVVSEVEEKEKLKKLDEAFSRLDMKIKMSVLGKEEKKPQN